jgi:hypothetical protein
MRPAPCGRIKVQMQDSDIPLPLWERGGRTPPAPLDSIWVRGETLTSRRTGSVALILLVVAAAAVAAWSLVFRAPRFPPSFASPKL